MKLDAQVGPGKSWYPAMGARPCCHPWLAGQNHVGLRVDGIGPPQLLRDMSLLRQISLIGGIRAG